MGAKRIKLLIVDGAAAVRQTLRDRLIGDPEIEVIGTAADPYGAARRIRKQVPDVIWLDIRTPRMNGITFLRRLMEQYPIPVVMAVYLGPNCEAMAEAAFGAGALDVVFKAREDTAAFLREDLGVVRAKLIAASGSNQDALKARQNLSRQGASRDKLSPDVILAPPDPKAVRERTETVVCMGASTGGTEALAEVLQAMPENAPAIVIVQHMPKRFTGSFAQRLNHLCRIEVREACDGDAVHAGRALIAPGDSHILVVRTESGYCVRVQGGPPVSRHRPSVDVLFRSAATTVGYNAVGVLMTGMGDDGALGLWEMRQCGAFTIAQDEASSIVFGMPKEAIKRGAADRVLPLHAIAAEILRVTNL